MLELIRQAFMTATTLNVYIIIYQYNSNLVLNDSRVYYKALVFEKICHVLFLIYIQNNQY